MVAFSGEKCRKQGQRVGLWVLGGERLFMPTKPVIVAIFAIALLFGVVVSGCNRNRDNSVASAQSRRGAKQHELSSVRNVRPAEVLSASAYRPPVRRKRNPPPASRPQPNYQDYNRQQYADYGSPQYSFRQPSYTQAPAYQVAQAYEPLPEPVPVSQLNSGTASYVNADSYYAPAAYQTVPSVQQGGYNYGYSSPASAQPPAQYYGQAGRDDRYGHLPEYAYKPAAAAYVPPAARPQSPDLAMARARLARPQAAALPPPPVQTHQNAPQVQRDGNNAPRYNYNYNTAPVPPVDPRQFSAPLPELEPVRYQRVAQAQPSRAPRQVPQVPVMMAGGQGQQQAKAQGQQAKFGQLQPVGGFGGDAMEAERALAPIEQSAQGDQREWVSSAATAMYW